MKAFTNAAIMFGAVALIGWLMVAQRDYQRGFTQGLTQAATAQASPATETNLATSMDRAMLALK